MLCTASMKKIDERFMSDPAVRVGFQREEWDIFVNIIGKHVAMVEAFSREEAHIKSRAEMALFATASIDSFAWLATARDAANTAKDQLDQRIALLRDPMTDTPEVEAYRKLQAVECLRKHLTALTVSTARWLRSAGADPEKISWDLVPEEEFHQRELMYGKYDLTDDQEIEATFIEAVHDPSQPQHNTKEVLK